MAYFGRIMQRLLHGAPRRSKVSAIGLWAGRVGGPSVRFLTVDDDHEFVVERSCLTPALSRHYSSVQLPAELRATVEAWSRAAPPDAPPIAELPVRWRSFANIATELIEQGKGHFRCGKCQEIYAATELKLERYKGGTEYVTVNTQFLCPRGHILLTREARFRMKVTAQAHQS